MHNQQRGEKQVGGGDPMPGQGAQGKGWTEGDPSHTNQRLTKYAPFHLEPGNKLPPV
jgi:hypothetical protein